MHCGPSSHVALSAFISDSFKQTPRAGFCYNERKKKNIPDAQGDFSMDVGNNVFLKFVLFFKYGCRSAMPCKPVPGRKKWKSEYLS